MSADRTALEAWLDTPSTTDQERAIKRELIELQGFVRRVMRGYALCARLTGRLGAIAEERGRRISKEAEGIPWLDGSRMGEAFAWSRAANLFGYINRSMQRQVEIDGDE